jgi:hypothetical protein
MLPVGTPPIYREGIGAIHYHMDRLMAPIWPDEFADIGRHMGSIWPGETHMGAIWVEANPYGRKL